MNAARPLLLLAVVAAQLWAEPLVVIEERAPLFQDKVRKATVYQGMVVEAGPHQQFEEWYVVTVEGQLFTSRTEHYRSAVQLQAEQAAAETAFTRQQHEVTAEIARAAEHLQLLTTARIQLARDRCFSGNVPGKDGKDVLVPLVPGVEERKLERTWRREEADLQKQVETSRQQLSTLITQHMTASHARLMAARQLEKYGQTPKTYLWHPSTTTKPRVQLFLGKKVGKTVADGTLLMARPTFKNDDWRYAQYDGETYSVHADGLASMADLTLSHERTKAAMLMEQQILQQELECLTLVQSTVDQAKGDLEQPLISSKEAYLRVHLLGPPPGRHPLYSLPLPGTEPLVLVRTDAKRQVNLWEKDLEDLEQQIRDLSQNLEQLTKQRSDRQQTYDVISQRLTQLEAGFSTED